MGDLDLGLLDSLMILPFIAVIAAWLAVTVARFIAAVISANEARPFNPPPQLWINTRTNEWESAPGSQRAAWWRHVWWVFKD